MTPRRNQPEYTFHCQVVQLLRLCLGGHALFFHIPNGGKRFLREAARLKAMGVMPGCPDIALLDGGQIFFIELKSAKGSVTEAQRECHKALGRAGSPVAVVRTPEELLATLKGWGIALKHEWHAA